MSYLVLAENEILTVEGKQLSFDNMVDYTNRHETVLRFSHGNFASSNIQDVEPCLQCEDIPVTRLILSTGEDFTMVGDTEILTTSNQWVQVSRIGQGDGIKTLTYNPLVKHPQLTPKIISVAECFVAAFSPVVSFNSLSDNILLSVVRDNSVSTLIPVRPPKELVKARAALVA